LDAGPHSGLLPQAKHPETHQAAQKANLGTEAVPAIVCSCPPIRYSGSRSHLAGLPFACTIMSRQARWRLRRVATSDLGDDLFMLHTGRTCLIARPRVPLLRHYFVLTFSPSQGEPSSDEEAEMLALALHEARRRASLLIGDPEGFTLIHSGRGNRRTHGWHVHLAIIRGRWQKAWLYFVLWGKNVLQGLGLRRDRRK